MDAKQLFESLKVDLTCPICLRYFTEPVINTCGHNFCRECLQCLQEANTVATCPVCWRVLKSGDIVCNKRLQSLAITVKMLQSHFRQSIRGLTTCDKHGKEENLFCEDDHKPLCGSCFLSTEHKEHKMLPLEKAAGQCIAELQESWNVLRDRKEKFQKELEYEKRREFCCKLEGQTLRESVASEFEKMHQFYLEEEQLHLQRLDQEARDSSAMFQENKARLCHQIHSLQMKIFKAENNFKAKEMLKSPGMWKTLSRKKDEIQIDLECMRKREAQEKVEGQAMKELVLCDYEQRHQFLLKEEQLHLQSLDQEARDNLAMFEESKARLSQLIHNLQMVMSEIEGNFEKPFIEMLQDGRRTLGRKEELLLQEPVVALPRWTKFSIPGMAEMLKTFQRDLTLDPETASSWLMVSSDLKRVRYVCAPQDLPADNPQLSDFPVAVLAMQSFISGKHYWEVEVGDAIHWQVGICQVTDSKQRQILVWAEYTSIGFRFGNGLDSWNSYDDIHVLPPIHKLGIFLDYERGHIALYNAVDKTLLYSPRRVAFHGPLHPSFSLYPPNEQITHGSLIICPRSRQGRDIDQN
ncbi:probable E3 ubiquitin-protein ligase TRIML1 [Monodelphis domestica]|uniref:probable E3 ubiquitin-protein ligase TRIML1 n=1 Tax=Monodelphis domestica TaxID=13616 RepID=UPI0000F2C843|nr:probable E3 ubiquitin-protein ligase TRIML1 [Monodelphis domestica]